MTDHKFTDEEIIELLNAYVERMCGKCNVKDLGTCCGTCFITAISQAADLINRPKAEIERLQAVHADMTESLRLAAEANKDMQAELEDLREIVFMDRSEAIAAERKKLKVEAIKEFANRLLKKIFPYDGLVDKKTYAINAKAVKKAIEDTIKEVDNG